MNELPIELIHHIYEYLDLIDLSKCKLINKKYYECVKEFRIKELSCCFSSQTYWFYINKPMKFNYNLQNYSRLSLSKCLSIFNLHLLKYLSISSSASILSDLNKFQNLEVLHTDFEIYQNEINFKLSLNNLQVLKINSIEDDFDIEIDTPKLVAVELPDEKHYDNLIFNYPYTVKYLKIYMYQRKVLIFNNLEFLTLIESTNLDQFDLQNLSKLKQISFYEKHLQNQTQLSNLIKQKSKLRRDDLKIYYGGIPIESINLVNKYIDYPYLELRMKNYENLIDVLDWVEYIHYNGLMNLVEQVPVDFHKKYCNIQTISIGRKVKDQNNLIQFISKCQGLNRLRIYDSNLNQQFFNQLPSISSLFYLYLEQKKNTNCDLNLNFISRMLHLQFLETNLMMSTNLAENLDKLKFFERFLFSNQKNRIEIRKMYKKFHLEIENEDMKKGKRSKSIYGSSFMDCFNRYYNLQCFQNKILKLS